MIENAEEVLVLAHEIVRGSHKQQLQSTVKNSLVLVVLKKHVHRVLLARHKSL